MLRNAEEAMPNRGGGGNDPLIGSFDHTSISLSRELQSNRG
jgi:hypothetical protein